MPWYKVTAEVFSDDDPVRDWNIIDAVVRQALIGELVPFYKVQHTSIHLLNHEDENA